MATKKKRKSTKKTASPAPARKKAPAKGRTRGGKALTYDDLVGRAVRDYAFLEEFLADPPATLAKFSLSPQERAEILELIANPAAVKKAVSGLRARMGRVTTMAG